jgi:hypothetical protein
MKSFRFRKTTLRNGFTTVFGGVGSPRTVFVDPKGKPVYHKRTRMQMYRRASQGWRNQTYARLCALKIVIKFGVRKPSKRFRR